MNKRRHAQQQIVESDLASYSPSRGYQREASPVRLSIVMGIILVGVLIILASIVGIMSLSDVIRGHAGETWNHVTAMWDALKWWLLVGSISAVVVFKVVLPVLEIHAHTAVERAEAARIREETRHLREARYHNEEHMPPGYIALPNGLGNYGQVISEVGRVISVLPGNAPSGNSGINPKHLMDFMERQNVVEADEDEEEEDVPLLIEAPKKILLSQQIERGLTMPDEALSVFGYPIDTNEPFQVPFFQNEDNFIDSLMVLGLPGQGKSTIGTYFAALTVNHRGYLLVIDPDAQEKQSLTNRLGPLKDFLLCEVADTPAKAKRLLELAEDEMDTPSDFPLLLLVDEFSMIMRHKQLKGKWKEVADLVANTVENYATRGRKRRRRAIVFGQISNATRTGGTELRDSCAYLVFRTPYKKAALVLQDASDEEIAELAPSLTPGIAIVSPAKSDETYIMQFTFPDERGLQIIAEVRAESEKFEGVREVQGEEYIGESLNEDLPRTLTGTFVK